MSFAFIAILTSSNSVFAQLVAEPLEFGSEVTIRSEILKEDRKLLISTPRYYDIAVQPLPVLYLLDGEEHFYHIASLVNFLSSTEIIPNMLVVAIVNTNRDRDYLTPAISERDKEVSPNAGGAVNFSNFLQSELIPWVDANYRTTEYRTLFGHSAGGYFALWSMLEKPKIFSSYIAASPALQWGDKHILSLANNKKINESFEEEFIFLSMGDEGPDNDTQTLNLSKIFDEYNVSDIQSTTALMPNENHFTTPHLTMYQGLQAIFAGWYVKDPLALYDEQGLDGLHQHFSTLDNKFGLDRGTPQNVLTLLAGIFFEQNRLDEMADLVLYDTYRYPYPADGITEIGRRYEADSNKTKAVEFYTQALKSNAAYKPARDRLISLGVDVDSIVKEIAPNKALLGRLVGRYQMPNGSVWEIQERDHGLFAVFSGNFQPLIMRSPTEYAMGFGSVLFEFEPTDNKAKLKVRFQDTKWEDAVRLE